MDYRWKMAFYTTPSFSLLFIKNSVSISLKSQLVEQVLYRSHQPFLFYSMDIDLLGTECFAASLSHNVFEKVGSLFVQISWENCYMIANIPKYSISEKRNPTFLVVPDPWKLNSTSISTRLLVQKFLTQWTGNTQAGLFIQTKKQVLNDVGTVSPLFLLQFQQFLSLNLHCGFHCVSLQSYLAI